MHVNIIQVPYDSGYRAARQGKGPARLLEAGIVDALTLDGHYFSTHRLYAESDYPTEITTSFELNCLLSHQVRAAVQENRFP